MSRSSFDIHPEFFIVVSRALEVCMDYEMREGQPDPSLRYEKVSHIHQAYRLNQNFIRAIDEQEPQLIRLLIE